jgi:hypothetical protein
VIAVVFDSPIAVQTMAIRLGIYHPLSFLRGDVMRAKVIAAWKHHPEFSANQVIASLRLEHPLGICRTWDVLHELRADIARRSSIHRHVRWHLDRHTAARVLVGKIWKRHPDMTAKEVIAQLGPGHSVRVPWVQKVMRECSRSYERTDAKQWRVGRRRYNSSSRWRLAKSMHPIARLSGIPPRTGISRGSRS